MRLLPRLRRSRRPPVLDEFGGTDDGSLLIVSAEGVHLHRTAPTVVASLRFLLARLQLDNPDGLPRRLALTSALKGEGVSYMSRSLASVIAYDTDASVVVVDLNWVDPPKESEPELTVAEQGLAGAVEGHVDVADIVQSTVNARLSLVAAGPVPAPRRSAMAGSRGLEEVLDKLEQSFDHMILDLPALLASSDAITLAQLAEGLLLVVQRGVTSSVQVDSAIDELGRSRTLGIVFNRYESQVPRRLRRMLGSG
jgi:Mrp family chromosome partitioning ATPase